MRKKSKDEVNMQQTKQKKKIISKDEMKDGWNYLASQGRMFKLFLLMSGYFIFINILKILGVISNWLMLLLIVPIAVAILIAYFIYMNKHGNDEMK